MRENNTKPSNVQQTKAINTANDLRDSVDAATRFINRFGIVKLLGDCGAYKEKGVPVRVILLYIFNLMFSPMSMYYQPKMGAFHEDFSKNTVYRFLGNIRMNWHLFMLRLSTIIIRHVVGLTEDKNNRYALLVDDTPLPKCGKAMELVSRYFNHVTMGYDFGYRVLTLAWTDGVTTIPVRYSLLASSYDEKVRGRIRDDIDGRTLGARIRKLARTSMNDLTVRFACEAVKAGIPASIIAFDSWFAVPRTISRLMKEAELTVIARLKTNSKQHYEYNGKMINIKALYTMSNKRRGKAAWKLSVNVNLLVKEKNKIIERIPVNIRQYGKRWNIECMFKCSKQYLRFGKDFQSPSFETQNAQVAIAFTRYMMIAIEQRESEDYRSCGELFMLFYTELQDITFIQSLSIIVALFKDGMKNLLGVTEEQIQAVVDYVVSALPGYLQRSLSVANGLSEAA